jgi:hypothetical protein
MESDSRPRTREEIIEEYPPQTERFVSETGVITEATVSRNEEEVILYIVLGSAHYVNPEQADAPPQADE